MRLTTTSKLTANQYDAITTLEKVKLLTQISVMEKEKTSMVVLIPGKHLSINCFLSLTDGILQKCLFFNERLKGFDEAIANNTIE